MAAENIIKQWMYNAKSDETLFIWDWGMIPYNFMWCGYQFKIIYFNMIISKTFFYNNSHLLWHWEYFKCNF